MISPGGAQEISPRRKPWEHMRCALAPEGRKKLAHGVSRGNAQARLDSPVGAEETAFLPPLTGLNLVRFRFPRLAPWANFLRPFGAHLDISAPSASDPARNTPPDYLSSPPRFPLRLRVSAVKGPPL
jgi:hypothetical protein